MFFNRSYGSPTTMNSTERLASSIKYFLTSVRIILKEELTASDEENLQKYLSKKKNIISTLSLEYSYRNFEPVSEKIVTMIKNAE